MLKIFLEISRSNKILYLATLPAKMRKHIVKNKLEVDIPAGFNPLELVGKYVYLTHFAQNGHLIQSYCQTLTCSCSVGYVENNNGK